MNKEATILILLGIMSGWMTVVIAALVLSLNGEKRCKHGVHGQDCFRCYPGDGE